MSIYEPLLIFCTSFPGMGDDREKGCVGWLPESSCNCGRWGVADMPVLVLGREVEGVRRLRKPREPVATVRRKGGEININITEF